jgi:hypothetical protein
VQGPSGTAAGPQAAASGTGNGAPRPPSATTATSVSATSGSALFPRGPPSRVSWRFPRLTHGFRPLLPPLPEFPSLVDDVGVIVWQLRCNGGVANVVPVRHVAPAKPPPRASITMTAPHQALR